MMPRKFSLCEKRILKLMIADCESHQLTETESLNYIRRQFGRDISRRTFYNYKKIVYELSTNKNIRRVPKWMKGIKSIHVRSLQREMEKAPLGVV